MKKITSKTKTTTIAPKSPAQELREQLRVHLDENSVDITMIGMSVNSTFLIKNFSTPIGLFILGEPGVGKTTVLRCMQYLPMALWRSRITPASVAPAKENADPDDALVNLLPEKTLMIPEMSPIFSDKKIFPVIASLMDGIGFSVVSGNGQFGTNGQMRFNLIGCKPDLNSTELKNMGTVGPRFTSVRFPNINETDEENAERLAALYQKTTYSKTVKKVGSILEKHYALLQDQFPDGVTWNHKLDSKNAVKKIATLSRLIARGRAIVPRVDRKISEMPKPEDNKRLFSQLMDITRGSAVLDFRNFIQDSDLKVPLRIALDSLPYDRSKLLYDVLDSEGTITSADYIKRRFAGVDENTSRGFCQERFKDMKACGICSESKVDGVTKPYKAIKLNDPWTWMVDYFKSLTA
tara:strand:- start:307 stop:1530 length:1224 start_codon:yes stop_codon:yes gene_type:complete